MCARSASIFDFPDTVNEELLTHRRLPRCVGTYNARVNWVNERGERYDLTSADLALRRDRAADKYYKYREMRAASHDALETQHADCSGCASRSSRPRLLTSPSPGCPSLSSSTPAYSSRYTRSSFARPISAWGVRGSGRRVRVAATPSIGPAVAPGWAGASLLLAARSPKRKIRDAPN